MRLGKRKAAATAAAVLALLFALALAGCGPAQEDAGSAVPEKVQAEAAAYLDSAVEYNRQNFGWAVADSEIVELTPVAAVDYQDGAVFDFYRLRYRFAVPEEQREDAAGIYVLDEEGYVTDEGRAGGSTICETYICAYRKEDGSIGDTRPVFVYQGTVFDPQQIVAYLFDPSYYALSALPEYTLKTGEESVTINENVAGGFPVAAAARQRMQARDLVSLTAYYSDRWSCQELTADVQVLLEGVCERVYALRTTATGVKTPRGIGVGSEEEALLAAYPQDLMLANDFLTYEMEAGGYEKGYGYGPQDGSQNYIVFYLKDGKIAEIEMGMGWDYFPFREEGGGEGEDYEEM